MVNMYQPQNCCTARGISHLGGPIPEYLTGSELYGGDIDPFHTLNELKLKVMGMEREGPYGNMSSMAIVECFTVSSQKKQEELLERIGFKRVFGPIAKPRYGAADLSLWAITGPDFYEGVLREHEVEVARLAEAEKPSKPKPKPKLARTRGALRQRLI